MDAFNGCFNSIKEKNELKKEIKRLLKGMSNICLKFTIEKNGSSQIFSFLNLKNLSGV